ncbi:hypothetical protein GCM10022225_64240 [Plantactinospora mayteni]|uniref:Major facilitator superfamily (MFS) profile domain-containing protein n=1 Tax=Plantactinospora mayteni TaxID=566021 RepID=A0ABQ4F098_9ACTN|nr:hypothetical protein Pma05_69250 [Plantactinospora mayteni]
MDIYGFLVAGLLITMGTLGDRIGRRKLLLTGAAAFGVASVLAALSTSAEMLIVTRALLAVAREAFTHGLHVTALVGAGVALVLALLATTLLPGVKPSVSGHDEAAGGAPQAGTADGAATTETAANSEAVKTGTALGTNI